MSNTPWDRSSIDARIQDQQRRIRSLEALVVSGSSDCLNCHVLILDGVPVPDELLDCVDATAACDSGGGEFNANNGLFQGPYGLTRFVGKGGNVQLSPPVKLQASLFVYTGPGLYAGAGSVRINLLFDGVAGSFKEFDFPDLLSQPADPDSGIQGWHSGWVDWFDAIGPADCSDLTANISIAQSAALGGPNCGWQWCLRWVITNEAGDRYRGPLDKIPPGEAQDDVIHFNSETKEWDIGPGDSPGRAFASFTMGG